MVKGLRSVFGRWVSRVGERLPTVRARLYALVVMAMVPALVILGYDEWLARQRGLAAFSDLSMRVISLLRRDLDERIKRAASRLSSLAQDDEVVRIGPLAARRLVDAFRDDRLYNNLMIVEGSTGDLRVSAIPYSGTWSVKDRPAYQRAIHSLDFAIGNFMAEPVSQASGLNLAQPAVDPQGRVTLRGLREPPAAMGHGLHR